MARALLIGPAEKAAIEQAIARAATHPRNLTQVKAAHVKADRYLSLQMRADQGVNVPPPQSEMVELPIGYRCALSFEMQPPGMCKHLSISVDAKGKLPSREAVDMIAKEFGCETILTMWLEEFAPGHDAVNLVALATKAGHA